MPRNLSVILTDYVSPFTPSAKRAQLGAQLSKLYPNYKDDDACKGDANRFIANVGGKWHRWHQVFPSGHLRLRTGAIPSGTRDSFQKIGNRWYLNTWHEVKGAGKPAGHIIPHHVELKTGMVIGTAEKRTTTGKWLLMHHWVWLGGIGPQPEYIDGLTPQQKIREIWPIFNFWNGDFFIVIRVFDPFDLRSK